MINEILEESLYDKVKQLEKENAELKVAISKKETTTEKNSEVEELKKQIEKMRNCANCRNFKGLWCKYKLKRKPTMIAKEYEDCFCICYDKWEFAK